MKIKYGELPSHQIKSAKIYLRRNIFYLLLYVDPKETVKYQGVDVNQAFQNVLCQLVGFNNILREPPELLIVMSYLESAKVLYNSDKFDFHQYRKLILDAGSKLMEVKEGDC